MLLMLKLGNNNVTHQGIKEISRVNWQKISFLTICISLETQLTIQSAIKDVSISRMQKCQTLVV